MSSPYELPLLSEGIQSILPHRYPFLMIDRIIGFEDGKTITGIKNVSVNEPFFSGHFPGRPVMPGVMIVEALAQLGVLFAKMSTGGCPPEKLLVFSGVEDMRFRRQVVPGDVLTLRLTEYRRKLVHWKMQGVALVGDDIAAQGTIKATEIS